MNAHIHFDSCSLADIDGTFFVPSKYVKEVSNFRFKVYFDTQRMVEFKCLMGKPENKELTHYVSDNFSYIVSNTVYYLQLFKKRKDSINFYLYFSQTTSNEVSKLYKVVFIE